MALARGDGTAEVVAVLDVGSNSVLLLVAGVDGDGRLRVRDAALDTTRLGAGLRDGAPLAPAARRRTARGVADLVARARAAGAVRLWGFATGAARAACDGGAFLDELSAATGVPFALLAGEEEARLAYAAVAGGMAAGAGPRVVADVGGRTTELALGRGPNVDVAASLPLGALCLTERHLGENGDAAGGWARISAEVREVLARAGVLARGRAAGAALAASGGTATALAALDLGLGAYDGRRVHGHVLPLARLDALAGWLTLLPPAVRARLDGLDPGRARILPAGALVLQGVAAALDVPAIHVSDHGVRHAYLVERLAEAGVVVRLEGPWV